MQKIHTLIHRLHNADLAILFVRIGLGVVFIHAGWLKLADMDMVVNGFATMGMGAWVAYLVAYCEFIGGILVLVGLFVRYAGIVLAIIMITATFLVHWPNGFGLANGGYEYTFLLFFLALGMVTMGAGKYSIAGWLRNRKQG